MDINPWHFLAAASIFIASTYILWMFYLAVMSLMRARDLGKLSRPAYILGLPILWVGLTINMLVNLFVAPLLFLEPPKELRVTSRLTRLVHQRGGWRGKLALWICINLLDQFDPSGHHCKCENLH